MIRFMLQIKYPNGLQAETLVDAEDGAGVEQVVQEMDLLARTRVSWEPVREVTEDV